MISRSISDAMRKRIAQASDVPSLKDALDEVLHAFTEPAGLKNRMNPPLETAAATGAPKTAASEGPEDTGDADNDETTEENSSLNVFVDKRRGDFDESQLRASLSSIEDMRDISKWAQSSLGVRVNPEYISNVTRDRLIEEIITAYTQ